MSNRLETKGQTKQILALITEYNIKVNQFIDEAKSIQAQIQDRSQFKLVQNQLCNLEFRLLSDNHFHLRPIYETLVVKAKDCLENPELDELRRLELSLRLAEFERSLHSLDTIIHFYSH